MPTIKELLDSAKKIDNRLAQAKQVTLVPGTTNQVQPAADSAAKESLFSIYKLTDGERGERASKVNLTRNDAQSWVDARPEHKYEIVSE